MYPVHSSEVGWSGNLEGPHRWLTRECPFAGLTHAQYATLSEAVQKVPELSDLAKHTKGNAFEKSLNDPNFVGTIFAPTNAVRRFPACTKAPLIAVHASTWFASSKHASRWLLQLWHRPFYAELYVLCRCCMHARMDRTQASNTSNIFMS